jgi:hypothetical protein
MKRLSFLLLVVLSMGAVPAFGKDAIRLHPKAESHPSKFAGPFVHLPDGGILTLAGTEAHVSSDKGKTWKSCPAIPAAKFQFGDRSLERTPDGAIVARRRDRRHLLQSRGNAIGQERMG